MPTADLLVEPQDWTIKDHVRLIEETDYGLPEFQRTFVWDNRRVLRLWESLHTGYPIGQFMFWEPDELDFPMRAIGRVQHDLSNSAKYAVIDGQQRLTAIWMVLRGKIPLRYNLERRQFYYGRSSEHSVSLDILKGRKVQEAIRGNLFFFVATGAQQERFAEQLYELNSTLTNYKIPSQTIRHAPYSTVVNIFKRVNRQGEPLSKAQIAMAGISSKWSGVFRMIYELLKRLNDEMGFDKVEDPDFIVRAWTAIHTDQHLIKHLSPEEGTSSKRSKYVAMATQEAYEVSWRKLERGVESLIDLMANQLDLTNFRFVKAYFPLVVVINYFAHRDNVSKKDKERLTKWLLMSFVQSRYSVRALSRLREDIKATSAKGGLANLFTHRWEALNPDTFALDEQVLIDQSFKSAYSTLLYILARKMEAVDWLNPDIFVGDPTDWHFHHIFPQENFNGDRSKLKDELEVVQQKGSDDDVLSVRYKMQLLALQVNNIANLAFLIPESNIKIGSRRPSDYLEEICSLPGGEDNLRKQLIPLDRNLWTHKAYSKFCAERRRLIVQAAKDLLGL